MTTIQSNKTQDTTKPIKVEVDIRPKPVSPAQKTAWRKFWEKVFTAVKEFEDAKG